MTDTIGWGDVDIDVAPPRRRRLRGLLLWLAVIAVVAGIAVAPSARARLGSNAASWLAHAWARAKAYDTARIDIEDHAMQRAAAGDGPLYARIVSALDAEEASRLRAIAHDVNDHHTWTADVHAAAVAIHRALIAEANDLDADAGRTSVTFSSQLYLETPTQPKTQSLQLAAQRSIDGLLRHHHMRLPPHRQEASTRLTSATTLLERIDRVTNDPLDLRLAIAHDGALDIWDLASGKGHVGVARSSDTTDFTQPVIRLGNGVLFASDEGLRLFSADGKSRSLPLSTRTEYVAAGDGSVWSGFGGLWRRYDSAGRQMGPTYKTPAGYADSPIAAMGDSVVISKNSPFAASEVDVWTPSTGHLAALPRSCDAAITAARDAIAYVGCDQLTVSVMDPRTGRVHTVHTPRGSVIDEAGMALTPDGTRLAFRAGALNGDESKSSLMLFDTRSGRMKELARASMPLSWSPDGSTLLVSSDIGDNLYSAPLGYWRDGMDRPQPIRITLTGDSLSAVLLP